MIEQFRDEPTNVEDRRKHEISDREPPRILQETRSQSDPQRRFLEIVVEKEETRHRVQEKRNDAAVPKDAPQLNWYREDQFETMLRHLNLFTHESLLENSVVAFVSEVYQANSYADEIVPNVQVRGHIKCRKIIWTINS